jgi:hypothetical protein
LLSHHFKYSFRWFSLSSSAVSWLGLFFSFSSINSCCVTERPQLLHMWCLVDMAYIISPPHSGQYGISFLVEIPRTKEDLIDISLRLAFASFCLASAETFEPVKNRGGENVDVLNVGVDSVAGVFAGFHFCLYFFQEQYSFECWRMRSE